MASTCGDDSIFQYSAHSQGGQVDRIAEICALWNSRPFHGGIDLFAITRLRFRSESSAHASWVAQPGDAYANVQSDN